MVGGFAVYAQPSNVVYWSLWICVYPLIMNRHWVVLAIPHWYTYCTGSPLSGPGLWWHRHGAVAARALPQGTD
jgi:hypothetical protein